jgi:hypothetical protein
MCIEMHSLHFICQEILSSAKDQDLSSLVNISLFESFEIVYFVHWSKQSVIIYFCLSLP